MKRDFVFSQELRMKHRALSSGGCVLQPQGALDAATTEQFKDSAGRFYAGNEKTPDLLVDLSGVKYVSSMGLGALIQLFKKSGESRSTFALYDPPLAVRRVLEISKLDFLLVDPAAAAASGPFAEYITEKESARQKNAAPR